MGAKRTRDARGKLCSVDFAEVVLYWVPRTVKPPAIVEEQLLEGILIGVRDNSNEVFHSQRAWSLHRPQRRNAWKLDRNETKALLAKCSARP